MRKKCLSPFWLQKLSKGLPNLASGDDLVVLISHSFVGMLNPVCQPLQLTTQTKICPRKVAVQTYDINITVIGIRS